MDQRACDSHAGVQVAAGCDSPVPELLMVHMLQARGFGPSKTNYYNDGFTTFIARGPIIYYTNGKPPYFYIFNPIGPFSHYYD